MGNQYQTKAKNKLEVTFKEREKTSLLYCVVLSILLLFTFCTNTLEAKLQLGAETISMNKASPSLDTMMEKNKLVGEIHYSYWFWDIYDAYLYSKDGEFNWKNNFILKLKYLRAFSGESIVEETINQIHKQQGNKVSKADLKAWKKSLIKIFPEIKKNNQLIGAYDKVGLTRFYDGKGKFLGEVKGQLFAKAFFDIWLGDNAQEAYLSRKLRGI
jgi:hypothetical protein